MSELKEYKRKWYLKNRKRISEKNKLNVKEKVEYNKKWRESNKDKWREHNREYSKKYNQKSDKIKKANMKWRKSNKEKIRAEIIANRKISFPKNKLCENCNLVLATQRHHQDYSKPLEVMFVCKPCHYKLDKERKNVSVM